VHVSADPQGSQSLRIRSDVQFMDLSAVCAEIATREWQAAAAFERQLKGEMSIALSVLLGEDVRGLPTNVASRLRIQWADEHASGSRRELSTSRYVHWCLNGIHTGLLSENSDGLRLSAIIGVTPDGRKKYVVIDDGYRESKTSWEAPLLALKSPGLHIGPLLVPGQQKLAG
jgi:hypothetical protein